MALNAQKLSYRPTYPLSFPATRWPSLGTGTAVVVVPATTLDPATKSTNLTLSNGNLRATRNTGNGEEHARSIASLAGGGYFELVSGTATTAGVMGLRNAASPMISGDAPSWVGKNSTSIGYQGNGSVLLNSATLATIATYGVGDNVSCAFNATKIWFRVNGGGWNNDILANQNPAANTGGFTHGLTGPLFAAISLYAQANFWDCKFDSTTWTYAAPSGFVQIA